MWSPTGQRTNMDDFRERVNLELKLTLSEELINFRGGRICGLLKCYAAQLAGVTVFNIIISV